MAPTLGFRAGIIAVGFAVSAGSIVAQPSITPPPAGSARVFLSVDRSRFFLGENVLVHYCLENTSLAPFDIFWGGDARGASRSLRFKLTLTDERGGIAADPDPSGYNLGGLAGRPTIPPKGHWCESLQLARYARIDVPGAYTVRVTHDLGWPKGQAPDGQTSLTLDMPTAAEAEQVVSDMIALPTIEKVRVEEPRKPFQDFSTLRYVVYLPPLLRAVSAGNRAALAGIGEIPSPEATRALIGFLGHGDPTVAHAAVQALVMRLPEPPLEGALVRRSSVSPVLEERRRYLRNSSWRRELAPEVRAAARRFLGLHDVQDVVNGALILEAVGDGRDAASVSSALTASLRATASLPPEVGIYPQPRGVLQELLRAAEALVARGYSPPAQPVTPGDRAFWLVAFGRGSRPRGWQHRLELMLADPIPYLRELALTVLPDDTPTRLFDAIGPALGSSDVHLQIAACDVVRRATLVRYREALSAIVRKAGAKEFALLRSSRNALDAVGGRVDGLEIMASRVTEPGMSAEALATLFTVFEGVGGQQGGSVPPAELERVAATWLAFIAAHRAELQSGRQFSLDDPAVTVGLVPRGWSLYRPGKPSWPPRER